MLRKLFPGGFSNSSFNSFKIVLVAEGCLANEAARFIGDCVDFIGALFNRASFGITLARPDWLGIYASLATDPRGGPAIEAPQLPIAPHLNQRRITGQPASSILRAPPKPSSLTQRKARQPYG